MPQTDAQWLWFAFFIGGAAGGWVLLWLFLLDKIREWRARK